MPGTHISLEQRQHAHRQFTAGVSSAVIKKNQRKLFGTRARIPSSLDELKAMAGYVPLEAIESRGIKERALLEKQYIQWIADDKALQPV